MKIRDAKQVYSAQLDALWNKKRTLSKLLKDQESGRAGIPAFDRLEISRELSAVSAQYEATQSVMEGITAKENLIHDTEVAKQQNEAMAKEAENLSKIMEVYRRIASGGKVPPVDEKKLMDYSHELYMAAKSAAMLAQRNDEEYDSLWEDEEEDAGEVKDAREIAGDADIPVPLPEAVAAEAAAETPEVSL